MTLVYHPAVQREVTEILRHYDQISPHLGDAFWAELMQLLERVAEHPRRFHLATRGLHRANLRRFPYHVLFRETGGAVRIIVVRHDHRHPNYGTSRR